MKKFILAALTAAIVTPVTATASVIALDLTLRIDRMYTDDVQVYQRRNDGSPGSDMIFAADELEFSEDIWGFSLPLSGYTVGDLVTMTATISYGRFPDPTLAVGLVEIGGYGFSSDTSSGGASADGDSFQVGFAGEGFSHIVGETTVGSTVRLGYCSSYTRCHYDTGDFWMMSGDSNYEFTVVSNNAPVAQNTQVPLTPVPLPAGLPLLVAALGGFAGL